MRDALAVIDGVGDQEPNSRAEESLGLLALVAGQDVELVNPDDAGGVPRWRIARKVAPDRVISVVDPDARHAHKTVSRRQDGFKAHLAVEPETGLVTDCRLTKSAGSDSPDATVGMVLLTGESGPLDALADSAYGTGKALAVLEEAGHRPLVKPWPLKPAVPGGYSIADFTVDETAGTATCPAGVTRPISRTRIVTFGVACRGCPLRDRCTTAGQGRSLHVHEHDAFQRAHRRRAEDPDWQADYRQYRPMVERSIAWLTARGNRKLRYRGITKNNAWLHHRTAALNLRRLLNLGLHHRDGAWALA